MIEYDVLELLKVLLKKWYIILGVAVAFSLISIPISQKSYEQALVDYRELLNKAQNNEVVIEETIDEYSSVCFLSANGVKESGLNNKEAANVLYQMLCDPAVRDIINGRGQMGEAMSQCTITLLDKSDTLLISSVSLTEAEFESFLLKLVSVLETDMDHIVGPKIEIESGNVVSQVTTQTITQVEGDNDDFANAVIKEPTKSGVVRTMITASILGLFFGIIGVLIKEYFEANQKMRSV